MNFSEAVSTWRADQRRFEELGVHFPEAQAYIPDEFRHDFALAMDAQPELATSPNSGIPALFTTFVDPTIFEVLFSPTKATEVLPEVQKGSWLDETVIFPVTEATGEVSSYGDYSANGRAGMNSSFPQRQSYRYQLIKEYGDLEMDRAGLAKINWVAGIDKAAAQSFNRFNNAAYLLGINGMENYGLMNDPNLSAAITPTTKAAGGAAWVLNGKINATANEVYADIEALFYQLVVQTGGIIDQDSAMTMALPNTSAVALTATNSFGVNVGDLMKKNFPNLKTVTVPQYQVRSAANPQGLAAGNLAQLIVGELEGQQTGFTAYAEKMRSHPVIRQLSSYQQKVSASTWGSVIRMPAAIAQMIGI